jgi:DNA-binding protein H-NS
MSQELDQYLASITDESKKMAIEEFKALLKSAKSDQEQLAKETAKKIEKWLEMRIKGELDNDELESLLNSRRRTIRQSLNTLQIQSRDRVQKVSLGLLNIVGDMLINKVV